jgi:hypothetical protein
MKVVYFANSLAHKRVLESFKEVDYLNQIMVVPRPQITSNVVPEDYSDFGVKNIVTYDNINDADKIIKKISPNVLAQTNTRKIAGIPRGTKRVYISHGMIGNHVTSLSKRGQSESWKGFNLYCGATEVFRDWVEHATGEKQNVVLNAFPQFDLLVDPNYMMHYKNNIIGITKNKTPSKVILFCGFCCKERPDFMSHNEDYFATVIELEKICRKHNFLALIKPKQSFHTMMQFLKQHKGWKWPQKYIKNYADVQNSKYLHFINTTSHIYRYFFADLFVCNGCSTVEIEACVTSKPLVLVRTKSREKYDPFDTVSSGAAKCATNINDLESIILKSLSSSSHISLQNALLKKSGIIVDGKAHERIQKAMVTL